MKNFRTKLMIGGAACAASLSTMAVCALDTKSVIGDVVGLVSTIAMYIGIVLLAWGIVQLVLAFKNEDADSKSRAIMLIVVAAVLIGLKGILKTVLNGTNVSVSNIDI